MPNIKSAEKRVSVTKRKTMQNVMRKSALKTQIRKYRTAVESGEATTDLYAMTTKVLDQAASKGVIHKNTAARKKSRLARAANKASQTASS